MFLFYIHSLQQPYIFAQLREGVGWVTRLTGNSGDGKTRQSMGSSSRTYRERPSSPYTSLITTIAVEINATSGGTLSDLCTFGSFCFRPLSLGEEVLCRTRGSDSICASFLDMLYNTADERSVGPRNFPADRFDIPEPASALTALHKIGAAFASGVRVR